MALRVAELETLFTGNIDDFEAKAGTVERTTQQLDGTEAAVDLIADAREALDNIDDLRAELEDVDRTRTEAEIQADVDDALRESERLQDQLREIDDEDVSVELEIEADRMRRELGDASEGLSEFKDESTQIAKESATSFTGEFEDVSDVVRDLLANAFVGFGPAGVAAGVAAAAGIGIAVQKAQELSEANTEARETAADIATGYIDGVDDASERFTEWATEVKEDKAWTFWKDEATTNIQQVSDDLQALGEDGSAAIAAIAAGSLPDMQDALVDVNGELDMLTSKLRQSSEVAESGRLGGGAGQLLDMAHNAEHATEKLGEFTAADRERLESLKAAKDVLEEQIGAQEDAEEIAVALLVAQEGLTEEEAEYELALRRANGELETRADLHQSAIEASLDLADGLADLTDKEDGWKATLDDGTQAGRDNIREVITLTDDIAALGEATLEQTGSQREANDAMRDARKDLLDQAEAAGHDRGEVRKLIDTILAIPDEAETDITADARQARRTGREARRYLNNLHADIEVSADTGNAYAEARAVQRYISGLNATMDVYSRPVAGPNSSHGGPTFADGGAVHGPGTETSDSILARLSDEEHVWTAAEVRGAGGHSEVERLRQLAKAGKLPGFADGGPVIVTGRADTQAAPVATAGAVTATLAPEDRALLRAVAERPAVFKINQREFATAVSDANRYSERRGG